MNKGIERILILAPHTDDGEMGCGGSIAKFIEEDKEVFYAAFSTADESVPPGFPKNILEIEVKDATRKIGIRPQNLIIYKFEVRKLNYFRQEILEELIKLKKEINPDLIFMPSLHDSHQDHLTVAHEGLRAFKTKTILGYELIWNNLTFNTTSFIKLDKRHVKKKSDALMKYESQRERDYMSKKFVLSLAKARGIQIGTEYAEAFEVVRWIM
ncbi:MAG: PIG-L deacetylase family protein [Candidatus Jettenia sp. CY-1]|nr:PIG-L family deacetylase [Candidatus Jettenia sp.]WKZ19225.1 MAG: PIG-L deacetylase family protein [Candidatus Jettenia sp. CY-1]